MKPSGATRFWTHVPIGPGCWAWVGSYKPFGYGQFWYGGQARAAHRFSWELHFGPIPDGQHVLHRCDNPPCVNPGHLFLGTYTDNVRDMVEKGRAVSVPPADRTPTAPAIVAQIRTEYRRGSRGSGARSIAKRFGVSATTVRRLAAKR